MATEMCNIEAIKVGYRARQDLGDIASLAKSIDLLGLLQPIGVDSGLKLVFGQRRLNACKELGWDSIPVRIIDFDNPLLAERDENDQRKPYTISEKVMIAHKIEEIEKIKHKESHDNSGRSADKAAAAVGMSRKTYEKAKEVVEAAEEESVPEAREIKEKMDYTGKVSGAHESLKKARGTPRKERSFDAKHAEALLGKLIRELDKGGRYEKCRVQIQFIKDVIRRG